MGSEGQAAPLLHEDRRFQELDWRVQRFSWAVLGLLVVAALAGAFGPGPLSHSTVTSEDGTLAVDYVRFARRGGQGDITIRLSGAATAGTEAQLLISRSYLEQMTVDAITPQPSEQLVAGDNLLLKIPLAAPAGSVVVQLSLTPDGMGSARGSFATGSGAAVTFWQFLYP